MIPKRALTSLLLGAALAIASVPSDASGASPDVSLTPADFHAAYRLPRNAPVPLTVAVVNPYDSPTLEGDLARFNHAFGLPACTSSSRCLRKVNQQGQPGPLPSANDSWGAEADLAVETVHGICQNCRLVLVEARTSSNPDLAAAVDTAARLGAKVIATSFTLAEPLDATTYSPHYLHPGVVVTAAAGDHGFGDGPRFPASIPGVVSVGGTRLELSAGGGYGHESAWSSGGLASGSGCSSVFAAGTWQLGASWAVGCAGTRAIADVAADADPATGEVVYVRGEQVVGGGTSLASPLIAGVFALAGGVPAGTSAPALLYSHRQALHDISAGSTGPCPAGTPDLCQARPGYDGPTGLGTPNGLSAFMAPSAPTNPRVSLEVSHGRLRVDHRAAVHLSVLNRGAGTLSASLSLTSVHGGSRFAHRTLQLEPNRRTAVALRLSRAAMATLRRFHRVVAVLSLRARDSAGRSSVVRKRVLLL